MTVNPTNLHRQHHRQHRDDFPIPREAFGAFALNKPSTTLYTKTLQKNLEGSASLFIPPATPPETIKLWQSEKPVRTLTGPLVTDTPPFSTPMDIHDQTLLIHNLSSLFSYHSETLRAQFQMKFTLPEGGVIEMIKANPAIPIVAAQINFTKLLFIDICKEKVLREIVLPDGTDPNSAVVGGSISWRNPRELTTFVGKDCFHYDARGPRHFILPLDWSELEPPQQALSNVAWNKNEILLATSSLEGEVRIYDERLLGTPLFKHTHHAASPVKILAWNPWNSLLVSAGASDDCLVKIVDLSNNTVLPQLYTSASVCSLTWLDQQHLLSGLQFYTGDNLQVHKIQHTQHVAFRHLLHPTPQSQKIVAAITSPRLEAGLEYYTQSAEGKVSRWAPYGEKFFSGYNHLKSVR